ncbi:hypothetical protein [Streptomyces scabiei]|uniref:hypothetical protein n=1 Tax=Streptomyces scabiei TaxID=1930 RepID=UPI000A3CB50E|nr:hypothetical protein [Streptomyces scabiei]
MTASSHPFGFHVPGPVLAPVPLRQVPALQAAVNTDLPAAPLVVQGPEPVLPMCAACGNRRGPLAPTGEQRYRSGAQVLVCKGGCEITPVQAATGVITAAMTNGAGTPQEWAQAEEDAGLLFDPKRAQEIADAAAKQARAEADSELAQARQDRHAADWFHERYKAVGALCAGRRPDDCLTVAEVLTAIDSQTPAAVPLAIAWDNLASVPAGDRPGEHTLLGCTTARGGRAVLTLTDAQRLDLAEKLLATTHPAEACTTACCGTPTASLIESDPRLWGGIVVDVIGTEGGPRWWCSPSCVNAAMTAARTELQRAEQIAAAEQAPALPAETEAEGRIDDSGAYCVRCGCSARRRCAGGCYWVLTAALVVMCSSCARPEDIAPVTLPGGAR